MNVAARSDTKGASQLAALPLGAHLKMDPWNGSVELIKARPTGQISEREKMPFEVTPFHDLPDSEEQHSRGEDALSKLVLRRERNHRRYFLPLGKVK